MSVDQSDFTAALLDPERPAPMGLSDPEGRPAAKRFDVYRNNVAVSLSEALATAFPVIAKLVGENNFKMLAGVFLRQHPPTSAVLMFYGEEMPGFLETFEPARALPYLPDVARLELALRRSYHAADAAPIAPEALQALAPDALMGARLELAPATRLIRSPWPIAAIWRRNMAGGPKPETRAEDALITRPEFDPDVTALPQGGGAFVAALMAGETFGAAFEAAGPDFDLTTTLGLLLGGGAITKIHEGTRS